jgi:hypothetical protein
MDESNQPIKRFFLHIEDSGESLMLESAQGRWVRYADHRADRRAEAERLTRERDDYRYLLDLTREEVYSLQARVEELEGDPRLALDADDLHALATGYGYWWLGPSGHNPIDNPLIDKVATVLERMEREGGS